MEQNFLQQFITVYKNQNGGSFGTHNYESKKNIF